MESTPTSDVIGSRLGPFQVRACIGVGGMGEVFRARDIRLDRDVAIKILPQRSAADPALLARFEREARLLATLNHPNIGAIYGFESIDNIHALVLELIEGDTLAERLRFGPLPLKETIGIARKIAEALDAAHSKGIIHRDLKPANIKLTPDGDVKVLDFGLGKVMSGDWDLDGDNSFAGSLSINGTAAGMILGTPAYMSPEQARGEVVDKRTDIWAFGCVLYQMMTGHSAFGRDTMIDTLAAIVEGEPDLALLPAGCNAQLRELLEHCLQKDQKLRLRDIGDALPLLADKADAPLLLSARSLKDARRYTLMWMIPVVVCLLLAVALAVTLSRTSPPAALPLIRSTIDLERGMTLVSAEGELPLAITQDGTRVAYIANDGGHRVLYVRELNSLEPLALVRADDLRHPFFSPDGLSVGYFAGGSLQTVAARGGPPLRICDMIGVSRGASWGAGHTIVFGALGSNLMRVSDTGGTPTALSGSGTAVWPEILPDGKSVLFTTAGKGGYSAFAVMPIGGGPRKIIAKLSDSSLEGPANIGSGGNLVEAHIVPGYLLYGQSPGVVRAVKFDQKTMAVTGSPVSLASSVERAKDGGGVFFAVSQTGLLVYASTGNQHQLVWVDRKGDVTPFTMERAAYRIPKLSPDGKSIAVAISDDTRRADIWLIDAVRGGLRRITTQGHNLAPTWTPDGKRIEFSTNGGIAEVNLADGKIQSVLNQVGAYPDSWSPDGKSLLYRVDSATGSAVWLLTPGQPGNPPGHTLSQGSSAFSPHFSPDGRWIVYTTTSTRRQEVYVAHAPDLSNPVMISTNGGADPIWSSNGGEIFYREGDAVMRVAIKATNEIQAGKPERLFSGNFSGESHDTQFDITKDGQHFLMVKSDESSVLSRLTAVQNWTQELKK